MIRGVAVVKLKFLTFVQILVCIVLMGLSEQARAQDTKIVTTVSVNGGRPFRCETIQPDGKTYLEVVSLSNGMNWTLRQAGSYVTLAGKKFSDLKFYNSKCYVFADDVGTAFNYEVKSKEQGLVIDLWDKAQSASLGEQALQIRVFRIEKLASASPSLEQVKVTLDVRNASSAVVLFNAADIIAEGQDKVKFTCVGTFDIGLKPGTTQRVEGIYFECPVRTLLKVIYVKKEDQIIGRGRF